jgi:hypothetical protein
MDDLRLIFVYTDADELFAWSPITTPMSKTSFCPRAHVKDIGTYLTYLYVSMTLPIRSTDSPRGRRFRHTFPMARIRSLSKKTRVRGQ